MAGPTPSLREFGSREKISSMSGEMMAIRNIDPYLAYSAMVRMPG